MKEFTRKNNVPLSITVLHFYPFPDDDLQRLSLPTDIIHISKSGDARFFAVGSNTSSVFELRLSVFWKKKS